MNTKFLTKLNDSMINEYVSVNPKKNPISVNMTELNATQMEYILGQYSQFPKNIVSFLLLARDKARDSGYESVSAELTRNMGEELGTETEAVTHYHMLLRGIDNELGNGLEKRLLELSASPATASFVKGIIDTLNNKEIAFVLGAIYAVESSAVPELRIVKNIVDKLTNLSNGNDSIKDPYFNRFFDMHLGTWEPGHEEGLRAVSPVYIRNESDQTQFEKGFKEVMSVMDNWWNGMYAEVIRNKNDFEKLGKTWEVMNKEYDDYIYEIINSPKPVSITPEKLEMLKKMQDKVFDVEVNLLKLCKVNS